MLKGINQANMKIVTARIDIKLTSFNNKTAPTTTTNITNALRVGKGNPAISAYAYAQKTLKVIARYFFGKIPLQNFS